MNFFAVVVAAFVVSAAAKNATFYTVEEPIEDSYIVVLEPQFDVSSIEKFILSHSSASIKYIYKTAIKGLSAKLTGKLVEKLLAREEVKYIVQDGVVQLDSVASWGLDRVNQRQLPLDGNANFRGNGGAGVNVYVIDTGIYPQSGYFEGRAQVAFDSYPEEGYAGLDSNGHGTHCAGTIGSNMFGVAKKANLFGVRVINRYLSGSTSAVVAGCDYVAENGNRPAVASMSIVAYTNPAVDDAVQGIINCGIAVVAAAGNDNTDGCQFSPGRGSEVIAVGSTKEDDSRSYFSNYGSCVDVFAPGHNIPSVWIGGVEESRTLSGTSMSCPHVTGFLAILLGENPNLTPAELKDALIRESTKNVVGDPGHQSPNRLLYVP